MFHNDAETRSIFYKKVKTKNKKRKKIVLSLLSVWVLGENLAAADKILRGNDRVFLER